VAVPGLLVLLDAAPGALVAARRGFWFGFAHHVLGLYWVTEAILVEAARFWWLVPLAVPALAALLALFIAAACALARFAPTRPGRVFALAGAWVLADLARQFALTGFPWNLWGADWAFPGRLGAAFAQGAALVSVHGMTLATLLLAALPLLGWRWRALGAALLVAWAGYGLHRLAAPAPSGPGITALLVQGDIPEGQKWNRAIAQGIFARYLDLTRAAVAAAPAGRPTLTIWPETASPYLLGSEPQVRAAIAAAAGGSATGPAAGRTVALIGAVRFSGHRRPRNALFALTGGGAVAARYDKWHLVPFGEYQPDWFPLPIQVVPGGGFAPGPGPRTLTPPGLPPIGPLICYEAIFPGQIVAPGTRPALLVNVTNDAWFGRSTGPRQHFLAARLRAIEEGLPLLRAANTGISAVIGPRGRVHARLGLGKRGVVVAPIPGRLAAPPFARIGLWLPFGLALACLLGGLAQGLVARWRRAGSPR
ncbi:MAG: apolipoprotein N-acyltransferase, partial [Rhodospirillales bacterium]|nr:apolipoprotein N-acyltransferase [Rhodospirillales bacterium]